MPVSEKLHNCYEVNGCKKVFDTSAVLNPRVCVSWKVSPRCSLTCPSWFDDMQNLGTIMSVQSIAWYFITGCNNACLWLPWHCRSCGWSQQLLASCHSAFEFHIQLQINNHLLIPSAKEDPWPAPCLLWQLPAVWFNIACLMQNILLCWLSVKADGKCSTH